MRESALDPRQRERANPIRGQDVLRRAGEPQRSGLCFEPGAVQRRDGGDERALLADHHRLFEQRVGADGLFEIGRGDLFAGRRDDDVLDPSLDEQPAAAEARLIAGVQPAVGLQRARRVLGAAPVAEHDLGPPDHELVVVADANRDARDRFADALGIVVSRRARAFSTLAAARPVSSVGHTAGIFHWRSGGAPWWTKWTKRRSSIGC